MDDPSREKSVEMIIEQTHTYAAWHTHVCMLSSLKVKYCVENLL